MIHLEQTKPTRSPAQPSPNRRVLVKALTGSTIALAGMATTLPARAQDATPTAGSTTVTADVEYGDFEGKPLYVDIYQPPLRDEPRPAVLVFHPGGFFDGDRSWMEEFSRGLAGAGYVAFAVGYRLYNPADERPLWPGPLIDAQRAVRWVRSHAEVYRIDPERIAAFGYSSGARLALQLGMRDTVENNDPDLARISSRVACVVDIAAAADVTIPWPNPDNTEGDVTILGGTPEEVPDAYRDYSVLPFVDEDAAPTLILHSSDDTWTPVEHSLRLASALADAGVEVVLCDLAHIEHIDWNWANAGPWTLAFLDRQLQPDQ